MADHQKIHPVVHDPEAPQMPPHAPTAPLVPHGVSKSDQGDPATPEHTPLGHPPPTGYPPFGRTIPVTHSRPPKRRSCCRKCLCWTIFLVILQILVLGILAAIIYFVFKPKIPQYSVDNMMITQFNLTGNDSLYAAFEVNITARNPNKKIGIYYESGSSISVWYISTQLCQGSLPKFYQGHQNTTVLDVALTGQTQDATNLLQSLQAQQQTGSIPLRLRATVPVRIKLGSIKLMKWKFLVRCNLVVDSLAANNVISIKSSTCKFRFKF